MARENGARGAAAVLALAVLSLCAGCTPASTGELAVSRLACDGWVAKGLADDDWLFVGDSVAIPPGSHDLGRAGEAGSIYEGLQIAKFGLAIRDGADVEVAVQSEDGKRVLVKWGPSEPGSALKFEGCGASEDWLIFAGGPWVSEPGCYEFVVRTGDRRDSLDLGIGTIC